MVHRKVRSLCCAAYRPRRHRSLLSLTSPWLIPQLRLAWAHNVIVTALKRPRPDVLVILAQLKARSCATPLSTRGGLLLALPLQGSPGESQGAGSGLHLGQLHACVRVCNNGRTREYLKAVLGFIGMHSLRNPLCEHKCSRELLVYVLLLLHDISDLHAVN